MSFKSLGLAPYLVQALKDQGFKKPFPIQEKAIPAILKGRDVLGIAQTGSGKTASFVLPLLMNLQKRVTWTKNRHVNALVVVPTRELAMQVHEVFRTFSNALPDPLKTLAVYGGVSINPQMKALQGVNVLVATPGRLLELQRSNAIHLSSVSTLVLDEADKMLNLGFQEEVDAILALLPRKRQNLLFSATLNEEVSGIHQILLRDPLVIKVEEEKQNLDLIEQTAYFVSGEKKGPLLRYLIKEQELQQVLVFCSTVYKADNVADKLRKNGIEASAIHGKKSQGARTQALASFKSGNIRVLVATDLLSRGIDIRQLPCVLNYGLPRSPKDFVHRIGRTGRAESPGKAITFVAPEDEHHFKVIQKKMGKWVTRVNWEDFKL